MRMSPTIRASYELLGVEPHSRSSGELKKAYHRMALLYHPDRNPDPEAKREFQKITEAYELLCDPARVAEADGAYQRQKFRTRIIDGLEITFGSFFGYRTFHPAETRARNALRIAGRVEQGAEFGNGSADDRASFEACGPIDENSSVLDNAAFDAIEVVYAGRLSAQDGERLVSGERTVEAGFVGLPWVVLSNQGLVRLQDGDLRGARRCYQALCERIPNNILFTYRLGLCLIIEAFQNPKRTFLGRRKPNAMAIENGIRLLRHCIRLGEERPIGRQKCLVIRKALADVLEKTGRTAPARALWREIAAEDPSCVEAVYKTRGRGEAEKLLKRKTLAKSTVKLDSKRLLPGRDA